MGITRMTAIIIQNRGDDICPSYIGDEHGRFAGVIELWRGEELDHILVSTPPCYDSKEDAVAAMNELIVEIRNMEVLGNVDNKGGGHGQPA